MKLHTQLPLLRKMALLPIEDVPSKLAQIYLYGVCGNQDGHFTESQSLNPQNEQFKLPKQPVCHDAIIQSEDRCALPHTPLSVLLDT